jgi:hypothetical protein
VKNGRRFQKPTAPSGVVFTERPGTPTLRRKWIPNGHGFVVLARVLEHASCDGQGCFDGYAWSSWSDRSGQMAPLVVSDAPLRSVQGGQIVRKHVPSSLIRFRSRSMA